MIGVIEPTMGTPRRSVTLQKSSHYLSTPILVPPTTRILPSRESSMVRGKVVRPVWERDDVDPVSRWVEEAAR